MSQLLVGHRRRGAGIGYSLADIEAALMLSRGLGTDRYVDSGKSTAGDGLSWGGAYLTIGAAITASIARDRIHIAPGAYNETVTLNKNNLTLIGHGGRGAVFVQPTTAGAEGMRVTGADVTLINVGVEAPDGGDYALNVSGSIAVNADGVRRFRAYQCKFEGPTGTAVLLDGNADDQPGDLLFADCEFAWCGTGLVFDASGFGVPTQVFVEGCRFHNFTAAAIAENDSDAYVDGLEVIDSVFDVREGGTAPTDFIVVDHASSVGVFSGNRFATATNAASVLTIGAGILWMANATEAGWSTARPI